MTNIVTDVTAILAAISPAVDLLDPAIGVALTLASKILAGVAIAEPTAIALYNQITSGTAPTSAQLLEYASNYETAYQTLSADIAKAG